jgi:hypothetical protein
MERLGKARLGEIERLGRVYVVLQADGIIMTVGRRYRPDAPALKMPG